MENVEFGILPLEPGMWNYRVSLLCSFKAVDFVSETNQSRLVGHECHIGNGTVLLAKNRIDYITAVLLDSKEKGRLDLNGDNLIKIIFPVTKVVA